MLRWLRGVIRDEVRAEMELQRRQTEAKVEAILMSIPDAFAQKVLEAQSDRAKTMEEIDGIRSRIRSGARAGFAGPTEPVQRSYSHYRLPGDPYR